MTSLLRAFLSQIPARQFRSTSASLVVWAVAVAAFGSGVVNLLSVLQGPMGRNRGILIRNFFPLQFRGLSEFVVVLAGFALVISSFQILRRKRRAFQVVTVIGMASAVFHFSGGLNYAEAISSIVLIALLILARHEFPVGSSRLGLHTAGIQAAFAVTLAICYGIAGFWLLDPREFGVNFHWWDAAARTLRFFAFAGDPSLVPHTAYAHWFLKSLSLLSGTAIVYSCSILYRPVAYRFSAAVRDRERAIAITRSYGRSGQDFFKQWPDKSFFFSRSGACFIAYRVARNYALALGDPVGPEDELEQTIREFGWFCQSKGWRYGFHQVHGDRLAVYQKLGFRRLKIGDDAVVDLTAFSLDGKGMKEFRNTVNKLQRLGIRVSRYDPPVPQHVLSEMKLVSDEWLRFPGRRERRFTLGRFDPEYLRSTPVYVAVNAEGSILAFMNLIPCYRPGLASLDLMRRAADAPNGIMDFLFAKVFLELKNQGVERFSLGMAPMAGFQDGEQPSLEERTVYYLVRRFKARFSYEGLRHYKAKYASIWEPRYDAYRSIFDLPRLAAALNRISELPRQERKAA